MSRALVLGGGGPVGEAWESGLVAGFAQAGVDLGQADFILGTSAGSIVGCRLASGIETVRLADAILDPAATQVTPPPGGSLQVFMQMSELVTVALGSGHDLAEVRREIGALAVATKTASEAEFLATIGQVLGELPCQGWPARDFACTAIDVEDGELQLWRASSGVDVLPAVASSCSVPGLFPPISLQGRRYIDGGIPSGTNADRAAGHDIVVVVALAPPEAESRGGFLDAEVEALRASGSTVVTITPDTNSATAFGPHLMDPTRRPDVARAGLAQGAGQAAMLTKVWR